MTSPNPSPTSQPNQPMPVGQRVKYNATTQDPRAAPPAPQEQGIGVVRQSFTRSDGPYYQVVWNPGDANPKSALYHGSQLTPLDQQQAQELISSLQQGQMADTGTPGSSYQQPSIPTIAAPPSEQPPGMEQL